MNIKNRIQKLEKITNSGELCTCENVPKTEVYLSGLEETGAEPKLSGEAVPDVCPLCRKPISKLSIIVEFTDETIQESPSLPSATELKEQLCS